MAALRVADPNYAVGSAVDEQIGALAKRLVKGKGGLFGGRRGRVEEAAQACLGINPAAVEDFRLRARWASARLSLLLSDDLAGSVEYLRQTEGESSGAAPKDAAIGKALAEDLLRTWVMEPSTEVRRRLGVLAP